MQKKPTLSAKPVHKILTLIDFIVGTTITTTTTVAIQLLGNPFPVLLILYVQMKERLFDRSVFDVAGAYV